MDLKANNKEIAEFLGSKYEDVSFLDSKGNKVECWQWSKPKTGYPKSVGIGELSSGWQMGFFRFHDSWEWLMLAVEEVFRTKPPERPEFVEGYYFRTFGMKDEQGNYMVRINGFSCHKAETLIEATYLAVVEFVKNYK